MMLNDNEGFYDIGVYTPLQPVSYDNEATSFLD